jgi:hypothetical protein
MEYPETNNFAQGYAFFSLGIVLISTVTFVVSTFEESVFHIFLKFKLKTFLDVVVKQFFQPRQHF